MQTLSDLLIIGGGINGAGIARDAAGRGLAVALCEQGDLVGATSSASSKLIHDDGKDNASAVTSDYHLQLDDAAGKAPLLSVFGSKLTTYRRLAERVMENATLVHRQRSAMDGTQRAARRRPLTDRINPATPTCPPRG